MRLEEYFTNFGTSELFKAVNALASDEDRQSFLKFHSVKINNFNEFLFLSQNPIAQWYARFKVTDTNHWRSYSTLKSIGEDYAVYEDGYVSVMMDSELYKCCSKKYFHEESIVTDFFIASKTDVPVITIGIRRFFNVWNIDTYHPWFDYKESERYYGLYNSYSSSLKPVTYQSQKMECFDNFVDNDIFNENDFEKSLQEYYQEANSILWDFLKKHNLNNEVFYKFYGGVKLIGNLIVEDARVIFKQKECKQNKKTGYITNKEIEFGFNQNSIQYAFKEILKLFSAKKTNSADIQFFTSIMTKLSEKYNVYGRSLQDSTRNKEIQLYGRERTMEERKRDRNEKVKSKITEKILSSYSDINTLSSAFKRYDMTKPIKHFGCRIAKPFNSYLTKDNYISTAPSLNKCVSSATIDKIMQNYKLSMLYFKHLDSNEFNQEVNAYLRKHPEFEQVSDLNDYKDKCGVYMMILDDYKQVYIGITKSNFKQRIQSHWMQSKETGKLVLGGLSNSIMCIDSFKHLDTTRIYVCPLPEEAKILYGSLEYPYISDFPSKFLCNRTYGGATSVAESLINMHSHNLFNWYLNNEVVNE